MAAADHLQVLRQHGLFYHHGIDLGDGSVAHYLEGREILRSPVIDFCKGQDIEVINHAIASSKSTTLRRAMSRIGEKNYNLLFNNCEHFANWCKTGLHHSQQMDQFIQTGMLGITAMSKLLPLTAISKLQNIVTQTFLDEKSKDNAKKELEKLEELRIRLFKKLDEILEKVIMKVQSEPHTLEITPKINHSRDLLVKGQHIEDALTALASLESRITALLNNSNEKTEYSHSPRRF